MLEEARESRSHLMSVLRELENK